MYVVKVLHGYIDKTGCRTREKNPDNLLIFKEKTIDLITSDGDLNLKIVEEKKVSYEKNVQYFITY